ncbi:MAG: chromosomal replication initiator protein DnaA [Gemmatimonadetes bacterium]|nr:chromosomal replication initiator protein DnaA [Gemmatimonadota bacterium]
MHASELTPPEIWSLILEESRKVIPPQTFQTWLEPTRAVTLAADQLLVEAENQFAADYIEGQYRDILNGIADELFDRDLSVAFTRGSAGVVERELALADEAPAGGGTPANLGSPLNSRYDFQSYVVGKSNQFAHAASKAVAENPAKTYNPLFIYGGVGLGKTHLMQAVGNSILRTRKLNRVCYLSSESFMNEMISSIQRNDTITFRNKYRRMDLLLIDDVQFLANKESTQEEFFHTFNALYDAHRQIVLTSDRPPKEIPTLEERLISRFGWGLVTDIQPPDLETRIAILQNKAERDNLVVPEDVLLFIAQHIKSNVRELEGSLIRLLAHSSLTGSEISIELAERVLSNILSHEVKRVTIDRIQREVSQEFGVSIEGLKSKKRTKTLTEPRQFAMFLCRRLTDLPLVEIGQAFGGRDHTTVIHSCDKIESDMARDRGLRLRVEKLLSSLSS